MRPHVLMPIALLLCTTASFGQQGPPYMEYYGGTRIETKQKLGQYLRVFGYEGAFSETDSTVEVTVTMPGRGWTIHSSFHFDGPGACYAITHRRCDEHREPALAGTLANPNAGWVALNDSTYLARYAVGQLLVLRRTDSCLYTRFSRPALSRRQYNALRKGRAPGKGR